MTVDPNWTYKGKVVKELPEDCEAIVYLITNKTNGMKYVGKKLAKRKVTRPPLKGKKNKRRDKVESDWRDYHGSSEEVKLLVEQGSDFARRILRLCHTKGDCSYWEAKLQFEKDVLLRDDYYNEFIGCKIHSKHLKK